MQCPDCQIDLQRENSLKGALWQCSECHGVAANLAVLRKLLGHKVTQKFWREAMSATPTTRECPSCHLTLHNFSVLFDDIPITLDLCKRCQIIWFDKNKLEAFPVNPVAVNNLPENVQKVLTLAEERLSKSIPEADRADDYDTLKAIALMIEIITHMI